MDSGTNSIRISVVLASYNGEKYIEQQINSWLKILSPLDEIVVTDDCSTDNTLEIVDSIPDDRIILIQSNLRSGYQKNFQRGIYAARGSIIMLSDQDDVCLENRVALSLQALSEGKCVCGDAVLTDEFLEPLNKSYFEYRKAYDFSALGLFIKPKVIGATIACRREFLNYLLPFPNHLPHDQWISLVAASKGELVVVRQPFILYRRHSSTVTNVENKTRRAFVRIAFERFMLAKEIFLKLHFSKFKFVK